MFQVLQAIKQLYCTNGALKNDAKEDDILQFIIYSTSLHRFSVPETDSVHLLQSLDLTFSIDLCAEEGGGSVELVPNGRQRTVPNCSLPGEGRPQL